MSRILTSKSSALLMTLYLLVMVLPARAASPAITSFTPTSGPAGLEVTITGTNLSGATSVLFHGVVTTFTVRSSTSITANVPEKATTGEIKVTTPSGTATSAINFIVVPTITSFTPASGIAKDIITVVGTAFTGATAVKFNGVIATFTVIDYKTIKADVPIGAETGKISVTTPSGSATSVANFKVLPIISSFTPAVAKVGDTVTITGTTFTGTTAVKFNGLTASFTVNSSTSISATVPNGSATGKITVTTSSGTAMSDADFGVLPTIISFTPTSGQAGTEVTITGLNFTGVYRVAFTGIGGLHTVIGDTSIVAYLPAEATSGKISVFNSNGWTLSDLDFTVLQGTTITSFTPTRGKAGQSVVITGLQFNIVTGVSFNGYAAQSYTIDSDTQITAVVPANATTGKIFVGIPNASKRSTAIFTVLPAITSFTPVSGKSGGTVVILGSGFVNVLGVKFNNIPAASWSRNSNTSINAVIPAGAGTGKLQVETLDGVAISDTDFVGYVPVQLGVHTDYGAGYLGALNLIRLNYNLTGPQTYNGALATNADGISLLTDLQPGTYSLTLSGSHWLKRVIGGINVDGVNSVNTALTNGDSDGDNQVNLFDFVVLDSKFGSAFAMADLDGSGTVNLFDYVMIDQNFGALGD